MSSVLGHTADGPPPGSNGGGVAASRARYTPAVDASGCADVGQEPAIDRAPSGAIADPAPHARSTGPTAYSQKVFVELCRTTDTLVALLVLSGAFVLVNSREMTHGLDDFVLPRISLMNAVILSVFAFSWQNIFAAFGLYDAAEPRSLRADAPTVAVAGTLGAMVSLVLPLTSSSGAFTFGVALAAWPATIAATLAARYGIRRIAERAVRRGAARVLIVGSGPLALSLFRRIAGERTSGYAVLGFVDTNPGETAPEIHGRMLGAVDDLEAILMRTVVDEVLIALPMKSQYATIQRVIEECERAGVQSTYSAKVFPVRLARPRLEPSGSEPHVEMRVVSDGYEVAVKRLIDVAGAAVGLVLLAPVLAAVAVAIKTTSPGPVLFAQQRFGWRKRRFRMFKFRTMVVDAEARQGALEGLNEAAGPVFKIKQDPRVTPLGHFLRKTSLDELPQLWNVLRGDMSLVGPRPLPIRDVHRFPEAWLMRRFSVRPGVTGLWQVSGRSNLGFDEWVRLDLQYIDTWSLRADLSILIRTFPTVLKGVGAS